MGIYTGTLGKISMDVKLMMQTEVEEVYEPFAEGRGSSSTMPQKRNPISSNYIHACVAMVRQNVAALLDAMVEDHERSTGPWEIEWIAVPEIFCLSAGALAQGLITADHVGKPVVGYVAGFTAPEGRTMGHAGAIVSGSSGTAHAKKAALEAAGVRVGATPTETARLVRETLERTASAA